MGCSEGKEGKEEENNRRKQKMAVELVLLTRFGVQWDPVCGFAAALERRDPPDKETFSNGGAGRV